MSALAEEFAPYTDIIAEHVPESEEALPAPARPRLKLLAAPVVEQEAPLSICIARDLI